MNLQLLQNFPDLTDWDNLKPWINTQRQKIAVTDFTKEKFELAVVSLPTMPNDMLGAYQSADWRRFAAGVYLADLACYTNPADQADFPRMLSVTAAFPQGFRLYMAQMANGHNLPIGYTGWYPISDNVFDVLHNNPQQFTHRGMITPLKQFEENKSKLYLFNYSVVEPLIGSDTSSQLVKYFAQSLADFPNAGMAAVTVSENGQRVAKKFGMVYTGDMTHDGEAEGVYCTPLKL